MNGVHSNGHTNGNHFRDADEDEVAIEEEEQEGVEDSLENVELSERGRQILRRININFGGDDNRKRISMTGNSFLKKEALYLFNSFTF